MFNIIIIGLLFGAGYVLTGELALPSACILGGILGARPSSQEACQSQSTHPTAMNHIESWEPEQDQQ